MGDEAKYILSPTGFHSMRESQALTDVLEEALAAQGSASVNLEVVEIFAELVGNAAEHGMGDGGAHAHVRRIHHRKGLALDIVIADSGPGIPTTLRRNDKLPRPRTDADAIGLAIQKLVSGTGDPTRGIGLWMTTTEMRKPARKMLIHSGTGLLTMYGDEEPSLRETDCRQGTLIRLTIPV